METKVISMGDINRESDKVVSGYPTTPKMAVDQWGEFLAKEAKDGWVLQLVFETNGWPLAVFYREKKPTRKKTTNNQGK